ncbi:hypothetical protein [Corynebacterium diphtheriae]|uniref:hypothetical protein n=1 Tax=Corynebacterium diphtheriae TaxID=1717 RepID=UPI0018CB34EA|nr:hypothetical protein [Corynebacterium diphtheriae]MBG9221940.1 hypothetical protein [Corynebacterium diphtheriae bv. mitis]MBG9301211.1 hypothetical protein [Corynebacterium diphtheriae bv. mitis]MBG9343707.1 hypothetical protein [Corynebacterium diphtheriae]
MFKRSLASLAAVTVASGMVVAPANAMTVRVSYDGSCSLFLTAEEAKLTSLHRTPKLQKNDATQIKATIVEGQLPLLRANIEKDKKALANPSLGEEQKKHLTSMLEENKRKLTAYENLRNALDACITDMDYDSEKPNGPKNPEGSEKPNGPKNPEGSEKPNGPKNPEGSEKPNGPKNPEVERALPSTNGAVIGAIVAVLGILAAALPVIKSILRALLP